MSCIALALFALHGHMEHALLGYSFIMIVIHLLLELSLKDVCNVNIDFCQENMGFQIPQIVSPTPEGPLEAAIEHWPKLQ